MDGTKYKLGNGPTVQADIQIFSGKNTGSLI